MHYLSHIPENITPDTKCIIILHGVGADEQSLFEFHHGFGKDIFTFSLQGPFSLKDGGYAWYPVEFSTGKPIYKTEDVEKGYHEILDCIDQVSKKYGINNENIFLMGFSQGAIMSYYTLWKSPEKIGGIIALSGRILDEIQMDSLDTSTYKKKKIFVGHGLQDQMIPFSATKKVESYIKKLRLKGDINNYTIGHSISNEEFEDIVEWINL